MRMFLNAALVAAWALSACGAPPAPVTTPAPPAIALGLTQEIPTPEPALEPATPATTQVQAATSVLGATTDAAVVTLTVWYAYPVGGADERVLIALVAQYMAEHPGTTVQLQNLPSYQVYPRWQAGVPAGTAADLLVAPSDTLGEWVRSGAVAPLDDRLAGKLDGFSPVALAAVTVDGHLYAVPGTVSVVALYYNTATVATPPATTDELLALVKSGRRLVLSESNYYSFGFFTAFGGQLMDAAGQCRADQGGFAAALQYLLDLRAAGANFQTDSAQPAALFKIGAADMIIDGPWVLGDLEQAWGKQLGVAPMPAGPLGPARPLVGVEGLYLNPRSRNPAAAVDLALSIFSASGVAQLARAAHDPPARTDVTVADLGLQAFANAAGNGTPRPQSKAFSNWWGPFGNLMTEVIKGVVTPAVGVRAACAAMNAANGQ